MESIGTILIQCIAGLGAIAVLLALFSIVADLFSTDKKFPTVARQFRMKVRRPKPLIYGRGDRQIRPSVDDEDKFGHYDDRKRMS